MEQQFDICIYGASETVDRNREILVQLDDSETCATKEFDHACQEEVEAFQRSIKAMYEQCERSRLQLERADQLESKAKSRLFTAHENTEEACLRVNNIKEMLLQLREEHRELKSKLDRIIGRLHAAIEDKKDAERSIEFENSFIPSHEHTRDRYKEELRHCQKTGYAEGISNARSYVEDNQKAIDDIHEKTAAIRREKLQPAMEEIEKTSGLKAELESAIGEISGIEGQVAAFLSQAQQNYAEAKRNETEAQNIVKQSGELRTKCNDAHQNDFNHLNDLKSKSKASKKILAALLEEFSLIQNADHEAMQYTTGVLSKLSEQMLQYTTYSLEG